MIVFKEKLSYSVQKQRNKCFKSTMHGALLKTNKLLLYEPCK